MAVQSSKAPVSWQNAASSLQITNYTYIQKTALFVG